MEIVTKQVDKGLPVDAVHLDFSKAFHKVAHNCLINKIKANGIGSFVANWIESWLRNIYQSVVLSGYVSDWLPVLSGEPQASVLGPILFIVYINDLDVNLNSHVFKYADDARVFSEASSLDKVVNLQSDLDKLHKWSEDWQMMSNAEKCKCLHIGYKNTYAYYSIGGVEVTNSSCERDLGVVIDESLNYNRQCSKAVLSANKIMGIINRTYSCKSKDNILNLYKSLVRPHLEHRCQAWRPYLQMDVETIEKVQRRMTRMIHELSKLTYEERLCRTNLLSLEMRRLIIIIIIIIMVIFKCYFSGELIALT